MSDGSSSGVLWAFRVLTLVPVVRISTQRGGRALKAGAPSLVKELASDECIEACCQPNGIKVANFSGV